MIFFLILFDIKLQKVIFFEGLGILKKKLTYEYYNCVIEPFIFFSL